MGELDHPVVVELPLRGQWTVEQTPAHRIPSHGTDILGMRYAYDFVRTDERGRLHPAGSVRWLVAGGATRECFGWGEPVLAATAGEVCVAVDDVAERDRVHPVRDAVTALGVARRYGRGAPVDPRDLAGNHVIVRTGAVFALYAHLVAGSVTVGPGEHVAVGDQIGRVGHSGNSTAPHLHFQLMDQVDPRRAAGVPCAFAHYEVVDGSGGSRRVRAGIPDRHERVVSR